MDETCRIPFSPADEERMASAAMWGIIVAVASIASSILSLIGEVLVAFRTLPADAAGSAHPLVATALFAGVISLGISLVLATFLLQASLAFRKVALTDEADRRYLLLGFLKLRNYFMMLGILFIVATGGALLVFCAALSCATLPAPG